MVAILSGVALILAGLLWMLRLLWTIRGQWDKTNGELSRLVDKMGEMSERDNRLEARLERHLEWHDKH